MPPMPAMGTPPPGGLPAPGPMGAPPGGPKPQGAVGPEKKKRPSIIFLILDFLVFGGAITAMVLLFLSN